MLVNVCPHASWAAVYDMAYQRGFGRMYDQLTEATVAWIEGVLPPPAKVLDFGAGTGRLALPLSRLGYEVTAVEPCPEMLNQLRKKDEQNSVRTVCARMEDFAETSHYDLALCVFTVIVYLLDESSLKKSFQAAFDALQPNGTLLLDIPSAQLFNGYSKRDSGFERRVSVIPQAKDTYVYQEELIIVDDQGKETTYTDQFAIRYWPQKQVIDALKEIGFTIDEGSADDFIAAGSHYYKASKPAG